VVGEALVVPGLQLSCAWHAGSIPEPRALSYWYWGYTGLAALAAKHNLALDIKRPPAPATLPPSRPGGKPRKAPRIFTPLRPLYKVENTFARLGMWRRLSRCYEETALGAKTWLEVACLAYLCGRLRVEPT
jgi:hypothetical protein